MIAYLITNTMNGMCWIGRTTKSVEQRFAWHVRNSRSPVWRGQQHGCPALHEAIRLFGPQVFTSEVLACASSMADLRDLETILIIQHNSLVPNGYNLELGGIKHPETRRKLSRALKGRVFSDETKAKMVAAGRARTHPSMSDETKKKLSIANVGQKRSAETCAKLTAALKARWQRPEEREKMSKGSRRPVS